MSVLRLLQSRLGPGAQRTQAEEGPVRCAGVT